MIRVVTYIFFKLKTSALPRLFVKTMCYKLSRKLYLCLIYMLFFINTNAQNLFFEKIVGEDINPTTSISGIVKDSIGYMWFATWNGVYRYDGKVFDYYYRDPNDKNSLPHNRIRNIVTDKEFNIWLYTFDYKYVKYNYSLNNFKEIDVSLIPEYVIGKLNSNSNKLNAEIKVNGKYYYLSSHLFTELDADSRKAHKYYANMNQPGGLLDDYITSFFIDNENIIWLGSRGGDIYKTNANRNPFELHYGYKEENIKNKLVSVRTILRENNSMWLGTDDGLFIYNNGKLDKNHPFYKAYSKITHIRTLFMDRKGGIWIGGMGGLEYYDSKTNKIKTIINSDLYPDFEIWSIYTIEAQGDNIIWVGLYNRLAKINLDDNNVDFFDLAEEIDNHSIMDLLVLGNNKLWLATEGNGIVQLEFDKEWQISNKLLINTNQNKFNHLISGNMVYALHQDKSGNVWVGTSEGMSKIIMNKGTLQSEKFQPISNKPNTYISAITDDKSGNVWVAHKSGISMIKANSGNVLNYHIKDQLSAWTFLERALYKDTLTDMICFGAKRGYVSFYPQQIKKVYNPNKIVLKSLYVSNKMVEPMKEIRDKLILTKSLSQTNSIELDYQNNTFSIELASLNYNGSSEDEFEYMLEGYENSWNKSAINKVSYNKVMPGEYTFKARPILLNSLDAPVVELKVKILSPWYATHLAIAIYVMTFIAIIFFVFREILFRDRLKNEIKLERLNAQKHEELNKEKLEFFTSVSHELKTPLTLISDPLKQLQEKELKQEDKEIYFSIVNRNVKHLTRLTNQILDFRKSEKGKLKIEPSSWDFNELVEGCYLSFKFIAIKRDIEFELKKDTAPLYCYLDLEKTEQIIMNVLSNAFKYTSNGGKVVLSASLNSDASFLKINIKDNGVGIDAESLKKIFKPFNNLGSRPFHGNSSGIGLSLTKNLINILNGKISIDSSPNKGTKVSIILPYVKGEEDILNKIKREPVYSHYFNEVETEELDEKNKLTILIVEDNPDVQTYLYKELSSQYSIIQEYDGKKGLDSAISNIPDLVISDVMMPVMEGIDLCKNLKLNESTCHIPVILLTAKDSDESQIEGYNFGAEAYITKPFSVEILKAQVKSVMENRMLIQNHLSKIKDISKLQQESLDLDNIFLKKVTDVINEDIDNPDFNSEMLAEVLEMSQRQLYRKLKAVSGSTVHEFVTRVKMDYAERLLKNSNFNISEIAYKVGFSEPSNFSRTFSKHFGCSPSKYLRK